MQDAARFAVSLDEGRLAVGIRVEARTPPGVALAALDLPAYQGVIALHGGAQMEAALTARIAHFLAEGLSPLAEKEHLLVADGGTHAGTFAAMGEARRRMLGTYPLVGVCPYDTVTYANGPAPAEGRYPLDLNHSHFIFVDGGGFGVESELLVGLATAGLRTGVALIVNGGEIVAREAQMHAAHGTPVVVVRGSGRMADVLADRASDISRLLPRTARLMVVDLSDPAGLAATLKSVMAG